MSTVSSLLTHNFGRSPVSSLYIERKLNRYGAVSRNNEQCFIGIDKQLRRHITIPQSVSTTPEPQPADRRADISYRSAGTEHRAPAAGLRHAGSQTT